MINIKSITISIFTILFSYGYLFSQENMLSSNQYSPYLNIANELLVRAKLSKRLPEVIDKNKFDEIANKLDSLAKINDAISTNRFQITDPEFHWCFSKLYVLLDNYTEAEKHYIQYNQSLNDNIRTLHSIFLQPINELDGIDLQTDTKLTEIIYNYIIRAGCKLLC